MPQATPELRARWHRENGEVATKHLLSRGYKLTPDWTWDVSEVDDITDDDRSAVAYLMQEWDYGGFKPLVDKDELLALVDKELRETDPEYNGRMEPEFMLPLEAPEVEGKVYVRGISCKWGPFEPNKDLKVKALPVTAPPEVLKAKKMIAVTHGPITAEEGVGPLLDALTKNDCVGVLHGAVFPMGDPFPVEYNCGDGCCVQTFKDAEDLKNFLVGQEWWVWEEADE